MKSTCKTSGIQPIHDASAQKTTQSRSSCDKGATLSKQSTAVDCYSPYSRTVSGRIHVISAILEDAPDFARRSGGIISDYLFERIDGCPSWHIHMAGRRMGESLDHRKASSLHPTLVQGWK
ncbi:predicted protein [Histoplasma capsulatum G186AR]|uniref:Uncharacterized protein n=1 Tax=Ajellomyces capsulatus (strain G186AR / H82 / ATCC MYA-2454 / RMSCC 2432) TaxID=447093 RepID=C0NMB8_AJECG|nr:uncharacterized protein HCBG_04648 [Histoplasma capsulatum G186AR]EEH07769.1 predicted protein [Histoplasma capsulatum G186AR]